VFALDAQSLCLREHPSAFDTDHLSFWLQHNQFFHHGPRKLRRFLDGDKMCYIGDKKRVDDCE
jgi:hypothetical protein